MSISSILIFVLNASLNRFNPVFLRRLFAHTVCVWYLSWLRTYVSYRTYGLSTKRGFNSSTRLRHFGIFQYFLLCFAFATLSTISGLIFLVFATTTTTKNRKITAHRHRARLKVDTKDYHRWRQKTTRPITTAAIAANTPYLDDIAKRTEIFWLTFCRLANSHRR